MPREEARPIVEGLHNEQLDVFLVGRMNYKQSLGYSDKFVENLGMAFFADSNADQTMAGEMNSIPFIAERADLVEINTGKVIRSWPCDIGE